MSARRLAAIMFTDIVGYTSLMGKDEDRAFHILRTNRRIHRPLIEQYQGTWLKEMGDGILASFSSASNAVRCADKIRKASRIEGIPLRIGIHEGEVVFEEDDVFGDGVNVASRLQELAKEGSIYISGSVKKEIKNKPGIKAEFVEEKILKNVDEPVMVYEIRCAEEEADLILPEVSAKRSKSRSIVVLPFINMSDDPSQEYFCDGMTEEIINALSHVESLKVIARTSAFMFKGKNEDVRHIGRKLDVDTLLEGSVRKAGNRLRISAQFVNVSDGSHIWSDSYNRIMEDVFAIQDEISLAIVDNLKVKLLQKEKSAIVKRHTEDLEAYNLYLKGKYYSETMTEEGFKLASKYFERSLEKDPNNALVFMGLASLYWFSTYWGSAHPSDAYPKAKEFISKALEIDDSLSEAHSILGSIHMNHDWDWEAAEREYKRALELNPNHALTHMYYSFLMTVNRKNDEAIKKAKRALELDPLSNYIHTLYGAAYLYSRKFNDGIKELQSVLDADPNYFLAHFYIGFTFRAHGMLKEAMEKYNKAVLLSGGNPLTMAALLVTHYELGNINEAEKLLKALEEKSQKEYIPPICFYLYYKTIGDNDQALKYVRQCCEVHDSFLPWLRVHPIDKLRIPDDPQYNDILEGSGLK
jgi:TolB-like protein/class 3 adenylate cyclase/Tfp pilus assembly protein PilF